MTPMAGRSRVISRGAGRRQTRVELGAGGGAHTMHPEAWPRLVGARVQRREDPRLLSGSGRYVDDLKVYGLLHVAFLRSDHAHARITGVDAERARRMPGVAGVFSAVDLEPVARPIEARSRMQDYHATPIFALARDTVRYVGEPVVAVVAESRYLAEDALRHVEIEYDPLDVLSDAEAAAEAGTHIHAAAGTNVLAARVFSRGDVDEAMRNAAVRVGGRFRFRRKAAVAMENRTCLAEYDRGGRSLTLHSSTQIPGIIRDALVEILDLFDQRVRVVAPDVGGGFGGKGSLYGEEITVCALSLMLDRPVKWTSDRMEDLTSTSQAFDEIVDAELGVDDDGRLLALSAEVVGDVGAGSIYPWTAALEPVQVVSFMPGPYRLPVYRGSVRAVATNKPPTGPYRGVGRPASTFVMERLIDMAARKLSIDPMELRLKNFVGENEFPYRTGSGIVWDESGFVECLESAAARISYEDFRERQREARKEGRLPGIGIASYAELTGIGSRISAAPGMPINTGTETATLRVDSSGRVTAIFGVASHGQGLETTLAQVVADDLGVRLEDIDVIHGDSAAVPHSTGTYASRSAVLAGGAAKLSAGALREKVVEAASHLLEAAPEDIEMRESMVYVAGTDRRMTLGELARAFYSEMDRIPKEVRENLDLSASKLYDPFFGTTASASHIAIVDVDPETCTVKIERYVVAEDCGRMINPLVVDGQVHGGVAQGIGAALYEEVVHDATGQILTASLMDYAVPSAAEIPHLEVVHLETESPSTLGGFRGMGEGGTIGAPAAVANAISDALAPLGIEVFELPATPERLFQWIQRAGNRRRETET